jgi:hypothetical protein
MENVNDIELRIAIIEENISELRLHINEANEAVSRMNECFGCDTVEEAQNAIDVLEEDWHSLQLDLLKAKSE